MSRDIVPLGLRMPAEIRGRIEAAAKANGRSMNAEILDRLETSFAGTPKGGESALLSKLEDLHDKNRISLLKPIIQAGYFARAFRYAWFSLRNGLELAPATEQLLVQADTLVDQAIKDANAAVAEQFELLAGIAKYAPPGEFKDMLSSALQGAEQSLERMEAAQKAGK